MFPSWLSRCLGMTKKPSHQQRRTAHQAPRPAFRPRLEVLEERSLPSATLPISLATSGTAMGSQPSETAPGSVSANGQYEVFTSSATNLVNGVTFDDFGREHVFLRNLSIGTTTLVDVNSAGTAVGDGNAPAAVISADGRYVAFDSEANDLTGNDASASTEQIYVRDMQAGQTFLVSLGIDGKPENESPDQFSETPSIAEDGSGHLLVAYQSKATNLTANDTSTAFQIFLTTLNLDSTGAIQYSSLKTTLVSADNSGTGNGASGDELFAGHGLSSDPLLSPNGSSLVFHSLAANLNVPGGYNDNNRVINNLYLYTPADQTLKLLSTESTTTTAATGNNASDIATTGFTGTYAHQALSANGQYLVFESQADNLVPLVTSTDGRDNIYRRDLVNGTTSLVSISSDGTHGVDPNAAAFAALPVITPDGRYVAFFSNSPDLTANSNGNEQVYVRDMQQGKTYLVSLYTDGNPAANNTQMDDPTIAEGNGQLVIAYRSNAELNQPSTTSNYASAQVFVTTLNLDGSGNIEYNTLKTQLASADSTGNGADGTSGDNVLSKDGSTLAFASLASNLPGETLDKDSNGNEKHQIFTYSVASGKLTQVSPAPPSGFYADSVGLESLSDNGQFLTYVYNSTTGSEVLAWNASTATNTVVSSGSDSLFPSGSEVSASISGDGSTIVFGKGDVFGRQAIYKATNWQSGSPAITQIASSQQVLPETDTPQATTISISDNGQVITYVQNIDSGSPQGNFVYVYNNGTTTDVTNGANANSDTPLVSADGSTVAFNAQATNLTTGITYYNAYNVFAYNVSGNTISLASAKAPGVFTSDEDIFYPSLSDNGRYLAFQSSANDLVGTTIGSPGFRSDAFAEDLQEGAPTLIATVFQGAQTVISGDGSTVAFQSTQNLTSNDTSGGYQIFTATNWQTANPTFTLVSVDSAGTDGGNNDSENPSISDNGQIIAFDSTATNLTSNDANANGHYQVFVRNLGTNTTTLASSNSSGTDGGNADSGTNIFHPVMTFLSADGNTVVYNSNATDLISGVTVPASSATNVFAWVTSLPPAFASAASATFVVGSTSRFTVTAGGIPAPTLSESASDVLPQGITFNAASGVLDGTPAAGSGGTYILHFTATNTSGSITQTFTLIVAQLPAFTSAASTDFTVGQAGSFTVTASGFPLPALSESGGDVLPQGIAFNAATGLLGGTPANGSGGTYTLHFTAANSSGSVVQVFTLVINQTPPSTQPPPITQTPPSIPSNASVPTTVGVFDPRTATWYLRDSNSSGTPDVPAFSYGAPGWIPLVGDWTGSGITTIGVVDPTTMTWYLKDTNLPGGPDIAPFQFGAPGWIPVVGDWNGDGKTTIGVVDPQTETWYLRNENSPGAPDYTPFRFGGPGWTPVVGDWNGDGTTTIGVVDPRTMTWYLKNSNAPGAADITPFRYGAPGGMPVVGDWDGSGTTTVGAVDPATETWYLRNENSGGAPDISRFAFGAPGWSPLAGNWQKSLTATLWTVNPVNSTWIARASSVPGTSTPAPVAFGPAGSIPLLGDWNGDGTATLGAFDPRTATWYLRNSDTPGAPDIAPFQFGAPGWIPVVGDWSGTGYTGIGVFDPTTGTWYLRNEDSAGAPDAGIFRYGAPGWLPVVGDWDNNGTTTIGVVDPSTETWYLRNRNAPGGADIAPFQYGAPGYLPVAADWEGLGTGIGAIDPEMAAWYLRSNVSPGTPDLGVIAFGEPGWEPVVASKKKS